MTMLVISGICFFFGITRWWLCLSCWWLLILGFIFGIMGEIEVVTADNTKTKPVRDWNEPKREGRYERQIKRIVRELNKGA